MSDRPPDELVERRRLTVTKDLARGVRHPRKRAFLEAYSSSGNITLSAESAGIGRATHYVWMDEDPAYAEAFRKAKQIAADLLEAECRRRAVSGVLEPVFYQGEIVGQVRKYSDYLMGRMLSAHRPEYREKREISGPDGGPIPVEHRIEDIVGKLRAARGLPENVIDVEEA